ncbi:hypothetical protein [Candidatus Nitrososphaera sp. FF02]|uniref:hypothetical protein n=1 Tax=Candidatus Nitrososphaera sp. FF02 TaxID=3398226 RepID=UPI0039E7C356
MPAKSAAALLVVLLLPAAIPASASSDGWQTAYSVGEFYYNEPPRPDQIFKIYYLAAGGTVESFDARGGVSSTVSGEGTLEVKWPRNYPYTNEPTADFAQPIFFINGTGTFLSFPPDMSECFFEFSIPFSGSSEIGFAWTYLATNFPSYGDEIPEDCMPETTVDVPVRKDGSISPLQQFKAGVPAKSIVCKDAFDADQMYRLVVHPSGKPYCVTRESATELIQRWGVTLPVRTAGE